MVAIGYFQIIEPHISPEINYGNGIVTGVKINFPFNVLPGSNRSGEQYRVGPYAVYVEILGFMIERQIIAYADGIGAGFLHVNVRPGYITAVFHHYILATAGIRVRLYLKGSGKLCIFGFIAGTLYTVNYGEMDRA